MRMLNFTRFIYLTLVFLIFNVFGQTDLIKYPGNPVINTTNEGITGEAWDSNSILSCVIYEDNIYKMWYTAYEGPAYNGISYTNIGYAESNDGITWFSNLTQPVLRHGNAGDWDAVFVGSPWVIKVNGQYLMWYSGDNGSNNHIIGFALSTDGITWTKYDDPTTTSAAYSNSDPVLKNGVAGSWDEKHAYQPTVIFRNDKFEMWYEGFKYDDYQIGFATSEDGITWEKYNDESTTSQMYLDSDPVLRPEATSWDTDHVAHPAVVWNGTKYIMYYSGTTPTTPWRIGFSKSDDGINWEKSNEPVLRNGESGQWDQSHIVSKAALFQDGVYKIWYQGWSDSSPTLRGTGYAEADGIVAHYHLDEASGTSITDVSGHANHGNLINGTWTNEGKFDSAILLDGIDDYFEIPSPSDLDLLNGYSIEVWVKPFKYRYDPGTSNSTYIFSASKEQYEFHIYELGGIGMTRFIPVPRNQVIVPDGGSLNIGEWNYILASVSSEGVAKFYVNCELQSEISGINLPQDSQKINFGRRASNYFGYLYLNGIIDEIRISNYAKEPERKLCNNPPVAICKDITLDAGYSCSVEITPDQVDNGSYDPDEDPITLSVIPNILSIGENQVLLIADDTELQDTCQATVTVTGGSVSLAGTVYSNNTGLEGVLVKVLDNDEPTNIIADTYTDAQGNYSFEQLGFMDYQVMIVEPLGYTAQENFKIVTPECGELVTTDFILNEIPIVNNARGKGYWKHQFDVYVKNKGKAQESEEDLQTYIAEVHNRYDPKFNIFADQTTFEDWQDVLSAKGNAGMAFKAKSHIAALALNIMSLKIAQFEVVTEDNYTAGDVLTFVSELILDSDPDNDELAKDLAEHVNEQQMIPAGIVQPTQKILYKENSPGLANKNDIIPSKFEVYQNYPNPFNPVTSITFGLPDDADVSISIYNSVGQSIETLLSNIYMLKGYHQVKWNASQYSSGIYYYSVKTGQNLSIKKMILMK